MAGVTKTWVTGPNPRDGHAAMDGETVPLNESFSDGSMAPPSARNCNCTIYINGKTSRPKWRSLADRQTLQTGELKVGDKIGDGINGARWAEVDDVKAVAKQVAPDEIQNELAAQYFNDVYGFNINMPNVVTREYKGKTWIVSSYVDDAPSFATTTASWDDVFAAMSKKEQTDVVFFDAIIGNEDRHAANFLFTNDDHIVAIDHGLSFTDAAERFDSSDNILNAGVSHKLTAAQRKIVERILADEGELFLQWDGRVTELSDLFDRCRAILKKGKW